MMIAAQLGRSFALCAAFAVCLGSSPASADVPRLCTGCKFGGERLAGADFSNATYVGTDFSSADLSGASFRGAKLIAANFADAVLRDAAFDGAICVACEFKGARLDGATFTGAQFTAADFLGFSSSLGSAALRDLLSQCVSCNFRGGNLAGANLSGSTLVSVDFSQADLRGAIFDGAVLCWYSVVEQQQQEFCNTMKDAKVDGASFRGVLVCANPPVRSTCAPVDAATLKRYAGSPLTGATLPSTLP